MERIKGEKKICSQFLMNRLHYQTEFNVFYTINDYLHRYVNWWFSLHKRIMLLINWF